MKLIDVLSTLTDNTFVNVLNVEGDIIARYDGRDSIPTKYNDYIVVEMYINRGHVLCITVISINK